jgi:hypothetical protein
MKTGIKSIIVILLGIVLFADNAFAFTFESFKKLPKEKKSLYLNAGVASGIVLWGIAFWDYGKSSPHLNSEGWFTDDSSNGGADKLGHFYTSYLTTHVLSNLYSSWGYEARKATMLGALSSFGLHGIMELGDSYSRYGFAYEDFIINGIGCYLGYLTYRYPGISRKFDLRLEYFPSKELRKEKSMDVITDYSGMKFLVATKLDGFDFVKNRYLKYLELHIGYFTRGYGDTTGTYISESRHVYAAIGVNLSKIFRELSFNRTSKILTYYQVPYTYVPIDYNLNN